MPQKFASNISTSSRMPRALTKFGWLHRVASPVSSSSSFRRVIDSTPSARLLQNWWTSFAPGKRPAIPTMATAPAFELCSVLLMNVALPRPPLCCPHHLLPPNSLQRLGHRRTLSTRCRQMLRQSPNGGIFEEIHQREFGPKRFFQLRVHHQQLQRIAADVEEIL